MLRDFWSFSAENQPISDSQTKPAASLLLREQFSHNRLLLLIMSGVHNWHWGVIIKWTSIKIQGRGKPAYRREGRAWGLYNQRSICSCCRESCWAYQWHAHERPTFLLWCTVATQLNLHTTKEKSLTDRDFALWGNQDNCIPQTCRRAFASLCNYFWLPVWPSGLSLSAFRWPSYSRIWKQTATCVAMKWGEQRKVGHE